MIKKTRALALSGMLTGLCLALLIVGSLIGIGTYAAPLIAAMVLIPVGMTLGKRYHIMAWIAASALSLILLSDREEALMFSFLFGWYPIARPCFEKLGKPWSAIGKYMSLNICAAAIEALMMLVIMPESGAWYWIVLFMLLLNFVFAVNDRLLPRVELIIKYRLLRKMGL